MAKKPSGNIDQIDLTQFKKDLSTEQRDDLLKTLETRFSENMTRHPNFEWSDIHVRLNASPGKLQSLYAMEITGGKPDVIGQDTDSGKFIFYDCSEESPSGRRSICYDGKGQKIREKKGVYTAGNALDIAKAMGIELLTESQYRELQKLGNFDMKTSSWIKTPSDIRELGGAIFADYRYNHVFIYHNSAHSFYSSRGFRGSLRV